MLFQHQKESLAFFEKTPIGFDMSDCGTGKTLVQIEWLRAHLGDKRALIVCPKSLMHAAWETDFARFAPEITIGFSHAGKWRKAFDDGVQVVIVNTDGVKNIDEKWLTDFDTLIVDESSAFKHHTSARSKALLKLAKHFKYRHLMSATPATNSITEIWHQVKILDHGERLGTAFTNFQTACCTPVQAGKVQRVFTKEGKERLIGPVRWVDKPGIQVIVSALIEDITVRHKFEDCVDIPELFEYEREYVLDEGHQASYDAFLKDWILEVKDVPLSAVNAGSYAQKLLQLSSGATYLDDGSFAVFNDGRYEFILDLAEEYNHCVVFYIWRHQLECLKRHANQRGLSYAVWDSSKPEIAKQFQDGEYRILFAQPASAGHGLTLTRAQATIWASPTYNLEHYLQGIKRIHRIGQKQKTQSVMVLANTKLEKRVYEALRNKEMNLVNLLGEFV